MTKPSLREEVRFILEKYLILHNTDCKECNKEINFALQAIMEAVKNVSKEEMENICEKVHQAYCKYHLENKGTEYCTKGDYSKLNEEGKEYDRRTVRAVLGAIADMHKEMI